MDGILKGELPSALTIDNSLSEALQLEPADHSKSNKQFDTPVNYIKRVQRASHLLNRS